MTMDPEGLELRDGTLLRTDALIGGSWRPADSGTRFDSVDPATQVTLATVADCGAADTRSAIDAAQRAFQEWRHSTPDERSRVLRAVAVGLRENAEDLARLVTLETGKLLAEGRGEVETSARWFEWFAEEARRIKGEVVSTSVGSARFFTVKQAVGVAALITPWNSPLFSIARKAPAAVAAGCPVVLKPSEETPLCALSLGELFIRAGAPAGLFNVVPTSMPQAVGGELTTHAAVRKISFTGSTAVGRTLMGAASASIKRVSLELGGNAPLLVMDDADLDVAVAGTVTSKFGLNGQRCVAANRILVQRGVHERFVELLAERVRSLRLGLGVDPASDVGPVIHPRAAGDILSLVDDAVGAGARVLVGGGASDLGPAFVTPTLLTDATEQMRCYDTEIFGPVAVVYAVDSEEDAIRMANDTDYGLAAYLFTQDIGRAWRMTEALEHGTVVVNSGAWTTEQVVFGGFKQSGIGREGGAVGVEEYLETKAVRIEIG